MTQFFPSNQADYIIFILEERLKQVQLSHTKSRISYKYIVFELKEQQLFANGKRLQAGHQKLGDHHFLIVNTKKSTCTYFNFSSNVPFIISSQNNAHIQIPSLSYLTIYQNKLLIQEKDSIFYINGVVNLREKVHTISIGDKLLTEYFSLEKKKYQWELMRFSDNVIVNTKVVLLELQRPIYPENFPHYHRKPRVYVKQKSETFHLTIQTEEKHSKKKQVLKNLLAPLVMFAITAVSSVVSGQFMILLTMGLMSLMTAAFSLSAYFVDNKQRREEQKKNKLNNKHYLVEKIATIEQAYVREQVILHDAFPSPETLCAFIEQYHSRIYERQMQHSDFLMISLGLGEKNSGVTVQTNMSEQMEWKKKTHIERIIKHYTTHKQVPITVSLYKQTIGLLANTYLSSFLENSLLQIIFFHSYHDVNILYLLSEKQYEEIWKKWRLVPHFHLKEFNVRGFLYNEQLKEIILNAFHQVLIRRQQHIKKSAKEKQLFSPHYLLIIEEDSYLQGHGLNELLSKDLTHLGVSVVWIKENAHYLPDTVTTIIDITKETGQLVTEKSMLVNLFFSPYKSLHANILEQNIRQLSNLHHTVITHQTIPTQLSLLELYRVHNTSELAITQRWLTAQPNQSIRSLIGFRGQQDPVYWDLHERFHGPHALVGGTTGSGKSEFLTTYLIGLAINYSPEDVGIMLIDWKGGGIANTLDRLPHFMGAITNLDGSKIARALASIKAELHKRQTLFAQYGVNNINGYMKQFKQRKQNGEQDNPMQPLPHLMIVSDEFAELKMNVPQFLDELTSVSRIGRSLGVHLILATQKPSGIVNDQIMANTQSKVALRMATAQDSNELLKTAEASELKQAGRGYLKVGENDVYTLFQSGYASALYHPEKTKEKIKDERVFLINNLGQYDVAYDPEDKLVYETTAITQLDAVIHEICRTFKKNHWQLPKKPWLPDLQKRIPTPLPKKEQAGQWCIPIGLLDCPYNQEQMNLNFHLKKQMHTAIFGSGGYGKTTVLQTIVMNLARCNTPDDLHVYLLDFGNNGLLPLKKLPHVADCVMLEESEKLKKMLNQLLQIMSIRKQLCRRERVVNVEQLKETIPVIIVVIDNYDAILSSDKHKDRLDEVLIKLLREGTVLSMYVLLTSSRVGSLRMSLISQIPTKMCLYLHDDSELVTLLGRDRLLKEAICGRGQVLLAQPTAIQFYLPTPVLSNRDIHVLLEEECGLLNEKWTGNRPSAIPMVPTAFHFDTFNEYIGNKEKDTLYIGLNDESVQVEKITLFKGTSVGIFVDLKYMKKMVPHLLMHNLQIDGEFILIDCIGTLHVMKRFVDSYINKESLKTQEIHVLFSKEQAEKRKSKRIVLVNGLLDLIDYFNWSVNEVRHILMDDSTTTQYIFIDQLSKISSSYSGIVTLIKDMLSELLIGGDLQQQRLVDVPRHDVSTSKVSQLVVYRLQDDELRKIILPTDDESIL